MRRGEDAVATQGVQPLCHGRFPRLFEIIGLLAPAGHPGRAGHFRSTCQKPRNSAGFRDSCRTVCDTESFWFVRKCPAKSAAFRGHLSVRDMRDIFLQRELRHQLV